MEWRTLATESRVLQREFYNRDAVTVARELLGKILVHGRTRGGAGRQARCVPIRAAEPVAFQSTPSRTVSADVAFAPFGEQHVHTPSLDTVFTGSAFQDKAPDLWESPARQYYPI